MEQMKPEAVLKKRLELALNAQRPKFDTFVSLDEIYHVKGKRQPGSAQVHSPLSWSNVETVAPRMVAKRPTVIYKPREDGSPEGADANQALFNYWWDKDGAFNKTITTVKGGLNHGLKMVRWYWKTEKQTIQSYVYGEDGKPVLKDQVIFDEEGNVEQILPFEALLPESVRKPLLAVQQIEVTTYDDPCMEIVSTYDCFIDPEAGQDPQTAEWFIFRYRKSLEALRSYKDFKNLNALEGVLHDIHETSDHGRQSRAFSGIGNLEDDSTVERVTCYEMWQKGKKGWEVCTVAAGAVTISDWKQNPFWHGRLPFSKYVDSVSGDGFWDVMGEIEPVLDMHYTLDTYLSTAIDNRVQAMAPKWKVQGDVDEGEIFEGNIIRTNPNQGDDAEPILVPDLTATAQSGIDGTSKMMTDALGIFDVNRGDSPSGNQTAGGIATVAEQGNARFNLKIQHLDEFFKEMGYFVMSLYQQHMTDEKVIRVVGEDGTENVQKMLPQDIAGGYDIDVETGSSKPADTAAERQDALQAYQLVMSTPFAQDPQFQMEAVSFALDQFPESTKLKEAMQAAQKRMQQQQEMAQQQEQQMMQEQQAMQQQQMEAESMQQAEQGGVEDHEKTLSFFNDEESKVDQQISELMKQSNVEDERELATV